MIPCPNCGERSVYEFRFGAEVKSRPSAGSPSEDWLRYTYVKQNESGVQKEWWYHRMGCRQWFIAVRNTATNEVLSTSLPEEKPGGTSS
ncbi:MAG: sarcosine oxidase subunit delta [Planctomycetes bacterium]|nr:sarcosine oxidase subunit delta [Planctomycetota bacterium]